MIQRFDLATDEPEPQKLHLAPKCVNTYGRDFSSQPKLGLKVHGERQTVNQKPVLVLWVTCVPR